MKSPEGISLSETVIALVVLIAVLGIIASLLFPAVSVGPGDSRKAQAKNDVTQIATAVTAYGTEYDRLPATTNGLVGGELLSALIGSNQVLNPRNIHFIDVDVVKKGKGGLRDGDFVDPWGGVYQIAIATGTNATVIAGTNRIEVRKKIAVWNDASLHRDASSLNDAKKNRRYVVSWE